MMNEFWLNYYGPTYAPMRNELNDDIPIMNMIGEKMNNQILIKNIDKRLSNLKESKAALHFEESMRLIELANDFLEEFFVGCADLSSQEEFALSVAHKMTAFADTNAMIQQALQNEFDKLLDEVEISEIGKGLFVNIIEESCNERVWSELSKQEDLDQDFSISSNSSLANSNYQNIEVSGTPDFESEECKIHVEEEKQRMDTDTGPGIKRYVGIGYSKKIDKCVAEWYIWALGDDYLDEAYSFFDAETGKLIDTFMMSDPDLEPPLQQSLHKKVKAYEDELGL